MKKSRNGFIKKLRYLCLGGIAVLGLMTIVATGGGGGGGDGAPPPPSETAPTLTNVELFNANDPGTVTFSFDIGDTANFNVSATDPDLDMTTLYFTEYFPSDSTTPYTGPTPIAMPSQSATDMVYTLIQPTEVTGPAGNWRLDFQIEDSNGNESNVFQVYIAISINDPLLAYTELLKGYWYFYYTIISTWDDYYTLDTITGDTNPQGGYWIYGTDLYGDSVIATYWPDDAYWALLDPGTIIDKYYVFYTDGNNILGGSCYYQIDNSTGDWSICFTLNGYKYGSLSLNELKGGVLEAVESEKMQAAEVEETRAIQSMGETVSDSIKDIYWEMKQVVDTQK